MPCGAFNQAATPNKLATNFACPITPLPSNLFTCPFLPANYAGRDVRLTQKRRTAPKSGPCSLTRMKFVPSTSLYRPN